MDSIEDTFAYWLLIAWTVLQDTTAAIYYQLFGV